MNAQDELRTIQIEPLAEGIYAVLALPGQGSLCNAGIVDLGGHTVIFDTLRTPAAAEELRRAAEQLTGRLADVVVNSHWHDDHVAGNQVFDGSTIIGTEPTRRLMATRLAAEYAQDQRELPAYLTELAAQHDAAPEGFGREQLAMRLAENRCYAAAVPSIRITLPSLTFERRLVLHGPRRTAELLSYGGGHTESDVFLYLPQEQILFAGDLAFMGCHPWLPDGDPDEWLRILEQMALLPVGTVIPGHGPVSDMSALDRTAEYIATLQRTARELVAAGKPEDDLAALAAPAPFDAWGYSHFFGVNVRFLMERLQAQAKD